MLTKKGKYGLKALVYLARLPSQQPALINTVAEENEIPKKFLEGILNDLKKAAFVHSKKGKGGGYFFKVDPQDIRLAHVMRLIEGPIALLPCVSLNFYEKCKDCDEKKCGLNRVMIQVRDNTLLILENKTVSDLTIK